MILVLLGTQNNSFDRLLKEIDTCIDNGIIHEEVIAQVGYTKYSSKKIKIFDFLSSEELNNLITKSNLVITHGGVGSILSAIKANKKVIAIPRLSKYNEHVNDHQIQIVESFDSSGYIKGINDISKLENTLKEIDTFIPNNFMSNNQNMLNIISNYIDNN